MQKSTPWSVAGKNATGPEVSGSATSARCRVRGPGGPPRASIPAREDHNTLNWVLAGLRCPGAARGRHAITSRPFAWNPPCPADSEDFAAGLRDD
jgi:hypothetical protein